MASSADVALKSCAAATQHARPRGRAARGPRGEPRWPEPMRTRGRGHASPRGRPRGHHVVSEEAGIWRAHGFVGPGEYIGAVTQGRYSGPHYILVNFHFFIPCETMFTRNFSFAGDVAARSMSDAIAIRPSRGCGVQWIIDQDTCALGALSDMIDVSLGDTWLREETSIFIRR